MISCRKERNGSRWKARSKVLRYAKKERDFARRRKEQNVNNYLSVTVHNSAPVNINHPGSVNVINSSVSVHTNFVNKTHC